MFVHPQFDPIAISLGPVAVRWYGLMYLVAFVLFVVLGRVHARRRPELGWDAPVRKTASLISAPFPASTAPGPRPAIFAAG